MTTSIRLLASMTFTSICSIFMTSLRYSFNFYTTLVEGREEVTSMMAFMRDELEKARENNEKVSANRVTSCDLSCQPCDIM